MTDDELYQMDTPKFPGFIVADMGILCKVSWDYKISKLIKLSDASKILLEKARNYYSSSEYLKADEYIEVIFDIIKDESQIICQLANLIDQNTGAFPDDLDERRAFIKKLDNINKNCIDQANKLRRKGDANGTGSMEARGAQS